ncbi:MAG: site-specific integrase [Candidatus Electrothrix sp. AR3]|nr:site-specific integrase [Candidatus Electrothrix sp. AR3]
MPYYNRHKNKWSAQVKKDGKKYQSLHSSKLLAQRWEVKKRQELEMEQDKPLLNDTASLSDFALQYLDYAQFKFSEKTYEEKKLAFKKLFQSVNPELLTDQLHKGDVLTHLAKQARHRSGYAANKDRKNLVAAWNWASEYLPNFPDANPFLVERFPEIRSNRYYPTEQDFWKVYELAETEQDSLMLLCYLHLAARRTEIFQLKTEDVDMKKQRIRLGTKKRKNGSMHYAWVPMSDRLFRKFFQFMPTVQGEWVFLNPETKKPYISRPKWLPELCQQAKVKEFGLHGIRHLSASILSSNNISLSVVKDVLRHEHLTTTEKYVHSQESMRKAVNTFK